MFLAADRMLQLRKDLGGTTSLQYLDHGQILCISPLQGTVLDRIDYNIEQTATRVESGLKHLQKAEKYQKKNRKMFCIVILFVVLIIMTVILIAIKS